jgi:predicted CopG family antitoxin
MKPITIKFTFTEDEYAKLKKLHDDERYSYAQLMHKGIKQVERELSNAAATVDEEEVEVEHLDLTQQAV